MSLLKENRIAFILIGLLAGILYINTASHEFVLDDKIVITENQFTKQGFSGIKDIFLHDSMTGFFGKDKNLVSGGRYRPLSMAIHAIEWEFFGDHPMPYHLVNILLYILTGILLLYVLYQIFPTSKDTPIISIAFIATALYIANPLHTEVVANIKSRDEIISIGLALVAFHYVLKYLRTTQIKYGILSGVVLFVSLLSKETSIVFIGLIPITIYIFLKDYDLKKVLQSTLPLIISLVVYVITRYLVIGSAKTTIARELMNNPFLNSSGSEKFATIFLTLLHYLKLSFVPHPLTHDYYPKQIPIVGWDDIGALTSLLIHVVILAFGFYGLVKRKVFGFIALGYIGTLILFTNLFFPIGTFMNERFLYVPSMVIAIGMAYYLIEIKRPKLALSIAGVLILLYSAKTITRNFAWESDSTLALTDINISSGSAKCNMAAGLAMIDQAEKERSETKKKLHLNKAVKYLTTSLTIYPTYLPPTLLLGNAYSMLKNHEAAYQSYENCLQLSPGYNHAILNLEYVAQSATEAQQYEIAKNSYLLILKYQPNNASILEKLGELFGKNLQNPGQAIQYLLKANELTPNNDGILQKLGVAYALTGDNKSAIKWFEQGVKADTLNARLLLNLGIAHQYEGNMELGNKYLQKAFKLEPELQARSNSNVTE